MKICRPTLDNTWNCRPITRKGFDVAADAEETAFRREKNSANIIALAELNGEFFDFSAERLVDRISPIGRVECNAGQDVTDSIFNGRKVPHHHCKLRYAYSHIRCRALAYCRTSSSTISAAGRNRFTAPGPCPALH